MITIQTNVWFSLIVIWFDFNDKSPACVPMCMYINTSNIYLLLWKLAIWDHCTFFLHWLLFVANPELDELLTHIFSHSVGVYFSFAPFAQQELCDLIKVSMFSSVSYALEILARKIIDCTNVSKTFLNVFILLRVPSINRG